MSEYFKEQKEVAEKSATKNENKLIKVKLLIELPSFKGKRLPKDSVIEIAEKSFDKKIMTKI